jgi:peptidoglycan L-alanyl-D-glutamate endopeptidase CwlK
MIPADPTELRYLEGAHPDLVNKIPRVMQAMAKAGHPIKLTSGLRTSKDQASFYAQGRTTPGRIVTQCDGVTKRSNHQVQADGYHHAVDVVFVTKYGGVTWDGPWEELGKVVEAEGLTWGGSWATPDRPHIEVKHGG